MTQVDFYITNTNSHDSWLRLACRITEKAIKRKRSVYLHSESETDAKKLDGLLWTFSQGSFVPHQLIGKNTEPRFDEAVLIGHRNLTSQLKKNSEISHKWDLMINLTTEVPEFFSRYDRVAEVVDADPLRREGGRDRFRFYRERGYELTTHNI